MRAGLIFLFLSVHKNNSKSLQIIQLFVIANDNAFHSENTFYFIIGIILI